MRWAQRGFREYYASEPPGTLFGIVQGGVHSNLRLSSLAALEQIGFAGLAIGGLAVGEPEAERDAVLEALLPQMPALKPRYLMGVGRPEDILEAVRRGIDMFDCVMPTRHARNAHLFTRSGVRQYSQCRAPAGHRPDRRGMRLLHLPQLQPQLFAASGQMRRDPRLAPQYHPQSVISISA